jgi:hypothetical protein
LHTTPTSTITTIAIITNTIIMTTLVILLCHPQASNVRGQTFIATLALGAQSLNDSIVRKTLSVWVIQHDPILTWW